VRLLADRQKTSSEEIRNNEHAHSVRFPQMRFVNFGRPATSDNTSDEKISVCIHSIKGRS